MFTPNDHQRYAINAGKTWYYEFKNHKGKPTFELSGPPGSGKTSTIRSLTDSIGLSPDEVLYMALVGKATLAMVRSGVPAKTIHSTIYNYTLVKDGTSYMGRYNYVYRNVLKEQLPPNIKLFVLDEAPMVPKNIANDLLSFGIPVIAIGDLNQLPPPFGSPFFLKNPDVVLTEIMRQALGNPIIALCDHILHHGHKLQVKEWGPKCRVIPKEKVTDEMIMSHDIIIAGKNSTRDELNKYVREGILGRTSKIPTRGDVLVARKNNWGLTLGDGIFLVNGMTGTVEDVYLSSFTGKSINIDFKPDFMDIEYFNNIPIDFEYLNTPYNEKIKTLGKSYYNKFEYGYAQTCHGCQGSQFNKVLVYQEVFGGYDFAKKWLYTAASRAIDELTILV